MDKKNVGQGNGRGRPGVRERNTVRVRVRETFTDEAGKTHQAGQILTWPLALAKQYRGLLDLTAGDVLNVLETAFLLNLSPNSVYDLVGEKKLPGLQAGKQFRFHREKILALVRGNGNGHKVE